MTVLVLFWTLGGGGGRTKTVSKNARRREEEKEPIGETIGAEMAKRMQLTEQKG